MAGIQAHIAPIAVIERVITTMQSQYATTLADADVAEITGLPLPAPLDEEYYPSLEADDSTVREQTGEVSVYVWQARALPTGINPTSNVSSSPSQTSERVDVFVSVMVACRYRSHEDITRLGKTLTPNDVMVERIHRYLGAAKLALFQSFCDETKFFQVDVADDYLPQAIYDAEQQIERAYGTVTFRAQALINKKLST